MMNFTAKILFIILLFASTISFAQNNSERRCGSNEYLKRCISKDSSIAIKIKNIEENIQKQINNNIYNQKSTESAVYTIPVVVHVVYNNDAQNISDEQILTQIDVINEDYNRANTDKANTPTLFSSVAASFGIKFCLAQIDPSGNATTGITRTYTTVTEWQLDDSVKSSKTRGADSWPSNKYLNIWVCNLFGDLGYSTFPGGNSTVDGVVIRYNAFGRTGNVAYPYNKGRTLTHELGHWLNLIHIWGDDASGSCQGTDFVDDTPAQSGPNYGCPAFPHSSCGNTSDMYTNFMDYTNDECMNIFTNGQKQRALFVLKNLRSSLTTSNKCTVGIDNIENTSSQFKILPNPLTGDILTVQLNGSNPGNINVMVLNSLGQIQLIKNYQNYAEKKISLNINDLSQGLFLIKISTDKTAYTGKFIKL
ncbi:MAG: M43 family zinc metalloprotease [Bacteroidota bacterium]|nr:M43 family zinc metalloprotease [Bacteroidota bacterium]